MVMRFKRIFLLLGLIANFAAIAAERGGLSISLAGPKQVVAIPQYADMSGITWSGSNTTFYVVRDGGSVVSNGCYVHPMTVKLDKDGNCVKRPKMGKGILLEGAQDAEGIARDPLCGTIWVSDEADASIREYVLATGKRTGRTVEVPRIFAAQMRGNLSLESLTISPDGKVMWTANEEALKVDGEAATPLKGTVVRLVKFVREDGFGAWTLDGMWAYECEKVGEQTPVNSGVSDLCALPDGTVLVLERECSYGTLGTTRIYHPDLERATDIRDVGALTNAVYLASRKGPALVTITDGEQFGNGLFQAKVACYEGLCLGPRNKDGSYNLMIVSDGGAYMSKHVLFVSASVQTMPYVRSLSLHGLAGENPLAKEQNYWTTTDARVNRWRISAAAFGRGRVKTYLPQTGRNEGELYGAQLGVQRSVWRSASGAYNVWLGVGGVYAPRQGGIYSRGDSQLGYGEAHVMVVPERWVTDDLSVGVRLGVAFDWLNSKVETFESDTTFATQGIVGLQATYHLTPSFGLFGSIDWRMGDDADFATSAGASSVDMTGYLWTLGAFFSF